MKKTLCILLALICALGTSVPALAAEAVYNPKFCDENGDLLFCVNISGACYCKTYNAISYLCNDQGEIYCRCENCGLNAYTNEHFAINDEFMANHVSFGDSIYYGFFCPKCHKFTAAQGFRRKNGDLVLKCANDGCYSLSEWNENIRIYRFVHDFVAEKHYSFIDNTADMYGFGKDYDIDELDNYTLGGFLKWKGHRTEPDSPSDDFEFSFWEKLVNFFKSIAEWFINLFK